jgi:hypothetical protein
MEYAVKFGNAQVVNILLQSSFDWASWKYGEKDLKTFIAKKGNAEVQSIAA